MSTSRLVSGLVFALVVAFASDAVPRAEFKTRRAALRKDLDGVVVLFARSDVREGMYRPVPEPNFFYLTGWMEDGAILLLTKTDEVLFLPHRNLIRENFEGRKVAAEDANAAEATGFDTVLPVEKFESRFAQALESGPHVYALPSDRQFAAIKSLAPLRDVSDPSVRIARLRMKKSPAEIDAIQHATDVSVAAHLAAWKRLKPGVYEYQAATAFTAALMDAGCEGQGYPPIFGSGPNAVTLHYEKNGRKMDAGEMIVMDAAAQCNLYTTDITRSVPVNGKFSARQKELYDIVLGAQNAAIAAIKPGVMMSGEHSLNTIAREYLEKHGKDLHGQSLGKYLTHGISHHVGLDVHDATAPGPLQAGMVITVEPGLYIPEEGIGIRIEDTVLVTETGSKVLSAALPRETAEIEKAISR